MTKKWTFLLALALLPMAGYAVDRAIDHAAHVSLERANLELSTSLTADTATSIALPAEIAALRPSMVATTVRSSATTAITRERISRNLVVEDAIVADKLDIKTATEIDNVSSIRTNAVQIKTESSDTALRTIDNITYTIYLEADSAVVSSCTTDVVGAVDIPSTISYEGTDYPVTAIGDRAFGYCSGIESFIIPEGVDSIGAYAFVFCTSLESITLPSGLSTISEYLFYGCSSLSGITIPEGVSSIGNASFYDCTGLSEITLSNGLISLGDWAFRACPFTSITLPEGLETIGEMVFCMCSNLERITIPESVNSLGWGAFFSCTELSSITLPSGLSTISMELFYNCTSLSEITLPSGLISIGDYAFESCSGIESLIIPEGVDSIGAYAFAYCSSLESITIPESVISLGLGAFYNCTELSIITLPSSLSTISMGLFYGCSSLSEITIPEGVSSIGYASFYDCTSLSEITLSSGLKTIGDWAFRACPFTSITLPEGLETIGAYAFYYCSALASIKLPASIESIGDKAYYCCDNSLEVSINRADPLEIDDYVFGGYNLMADMTLYVPSGSKAAYEAADVWCEFGTIVEEEFISGLTSTTATTLQIAVQGDVLVVAGVEAGTAITVYNVQGAVVASLVASGGATELPYLASGIYIIRVGNEVVKVVR